MTTIQTGDIVKMAKGRDKWRVVAIDRVGVATLANTHINRTRIAPVSTLRKVDPKTGRLEANSEEG